MAWHVEDVSPAEVYTFRWGRGAGYFTVHAGDIGASHSNERLVDTVRAASDWATEADVTAHAKRWLRATAHARPLRP
ncbi:hypothetical protein GCM10010470_42640 [Saccharopolyspora taberi]|uniref:Uncharacterized protein n=1 Tax=Saccharopolyspora taberi TaxID=60895 RepID=A0ABN3VI17_9PSEU